MGRPLKIAFAVGTSQHDAGTGREVVDLTAAGVSAVLPVGIIGGNPTGVNNYTVLVHFKDASGTLYNDGFIVAQKGKKTFIVQSVAGGVATKTRCVLVGSGTILAKQMFINAKDKSGAAFYAVRIDTRKVHSATASWHGVVVTTAQLASYTGDGVHAVIEGA